MKEQDIQQWSHVLNQARISATPMAQISTQIQGFTRSDAYSIQENGVSFRQSKGEKFIGYKMGLTSEAKRKQMNLDSPLYGVLTDKMQVQKEFLLKGSIHPKIEPEIAFLIRDSLSENPTREEVLGATEAVCACMEILDSRYQHFKYFSMEDVISDNSSSSHFVLGPWVRDFQKLDLKNRTMKMFVGDQLAQAGNSADISGDPVVSVIQLCQLLAERKHRVPKNSIVLAGAATIAVALEPGMKVRLEIPGLPNAQVSVKHE